MRDSQDFRRNGIYFKACDSGAKRNLLHFDGESGLAVSICHALSRNGGRSASDGSGAVRLLSRASGAAEAVSVPLKKVCEVVSQIEGHAAIHHTTKSGKMQTKASCLPHKKICSDNKKPHVVQTTCGSLFLENVRLSQQR